MQLVKLSSGYSRVGPKYNMMNLFIRSGHMKTKTQREHCVTGKPATEVIHPQAMPETLKRAAHLQQLGRSKEGCPAGLRESAALLAP